MTFNQRLASAASRVEARLGEILQQDSAHVPPRLAAALQHGVLGGGKRFRPFLVIECARLFDAPEIAAVTVGAALELVHCYSLVHDDLPAMDNDSLRRGQPTVWKAFDDWTAILAGDALLTLAFEVLAMPAAHPKAEVRVELIRALADSSGRAGMVGGQALDLEADKRGEPATPSVDQIRRLQAMKTGALIRFATEAGAIVGEASAADRAALRRFGEHLGFAFQISDDLLDATGDAVTVGKAVAKDADAGKATLVSVIGIEAARCRLAEVEAAAIAEIERFGAKAGTLVEATRFMSRRQS